MSAQPKQDSNKRKRTTAEEHWLDSEDDQPPTKKLKREVISKGWFLTWNNYSEQSIDVLLALKPQKYMIQEEKGAKGTPHLQGVLLFNKKVKKSWLCEECPNVDWSRARNIAACINYCSKVETRNGQIWSKGFKAAKMIVFDPLDGLELYNYQRQIINICKQDCKKRDRRIYWLWSEHGNLGKSALCKHLALKYDAICIGGTWKDAYYAITQLLAKNIQPKIVLFDLCRDMGNKISYTAIEGIKNGMFFSPKYESVMALYNVPHIFVFANQPPEEDRLSEDRWRVTHLNQYNDLKKLIPKKFNFNKNRKF